MAFTQQQYNDLCAAIASGATFVKYSDKEVRYRDLSEMQALKRQMELDLGINRNPSRKTITRYDKGLR